MSITTDRDLLETVRGLAAATVLNANGCYEEGAFRLLQALDAAAPGLTRVERLLLLTHTAFALETDRDTATVCCFAAKDELHALGHALDGIAGTAAAFRSPPWEIVCAGLDLDPDNRPQDSRRALRHAQDADALAGLPLSLSMPTIAVACGDGDHTGPAAA